MALTPATIQAQTSQSFMQVADSLFMLMQQAYEQKDYPTGIRLNQELIDAYYAADAQTRQEQAWLENGLYYQLACFQALAGQKDEAIEALQKAVDRGWEDFYKTRDDADLAALHGDERYIRLLDKLAETGDFLRILKESPAYASNQRTDTLPRFTYSDPESDYLRQVRAHFRLDSVAAAGDELTRIKAVLTFVHNRFPHNGNLNNPKGWNIIRWDSLRTKPGFGLNCGALAHVLNTCYAALGIPSRVASCLPLRYINDCHSINAVYSQTLGKWIWMDPTNNAWVTDENGTLLGIAEVRQRLIDGKPLRLNAEANWNNQSPVEAGQYLYQYMAKNLYSIQCTAGSAGGKVVILSPTGITDGYPFPPDLVVHDNAWFWQVPSDK